MQAGRSEAGSGDGEESSEPAGGDSQGAGQGMLPVLFLRHRALGHMRPHFFTGHTHFPGVLRGSVTKSFSLTKL